MRLGVAMETKQGSLGGAEDARGKVGELESSTALLGIPEDLERLLGLVWLGPSAVTAGKSPLSCHTA